MSSLDIHVEDRKAKRLIRRSQVALSSANVAAWMRGAMDQHVRVRASRRFKSEGDSAVGGGWAPLADATVEIRENLGYPGEHPINVRAGKLESYITGTPGQITHSQGMVQMDHLATMPAEEKVRKSVVQAQYGGKNSPPRPVLAYDQEDLAFALASLSEQIIRVIKRGSI